MLNLLPLLVLAGGLLLTQQLWQFEREHSLAVLRSDFDARAGETKAFIERRMRTHEQSLRAFQGLYAVHHQLDRAEFHRYVGSLRLKERFPGIRDISFAEFVPSGQKARLEARAGIVIEPAGERDAYAPIVYTEPLSVSEAAHFGTDNLVPAYARAALLQARDSGEPTLSGMATFADGPGFQFVTALYRGEGLPATTAERREKLSGWVTMSFNMRNLMDNILGRPFEDLDVEIYDSDGVGTTDASVLYDSDRLLRLGNRSALLRNTIGIQVAGHPWTVAVYSLPSFEARLDESKPRAIAIGGSLVSFSLAGIVWLLLHGRTLALERASRMTRQLEQGERRYRLMFEDNASMSVLIDQASGRLVDVNPAAAAYWGYTRDELLGMTVFDINSEPREKVGAIMQRLKTFGDAMHVETRHRLKSGEVRDVEVFAGLLDYDGVPVCHANFYDLGRRRQIELEQIRSLTDGFPVAVVLIDAQGFILLANPAAAKTFRCTTDTLVGRYASCLVPQHEVPQYARAFTEYVRNPTPMELTESPSLRGRRSDGEEFPCELRLAPFRMGGRKAVIVSVYDITARKQAEFALRKLQRAVEQSSVSIVITDTQGVIEYVNPVFSEVTGYTREEALGKSTRLLQSGETPRETYQQLWQTISSGGVWKGEVRNRKKSGELFWEEVSISPVLNDGGGIANYIAVKEDITERKRIEADLKQAKEAAEAASKAKSDFLAMISHEIRTPMNGVIGLSALLQETALDAEQEKYAATLKQSAESLLFFINDILDFSKIEAGRLEVETIDFDLRALLDHLHAMLVFRAREKKLEFNIWIDPNVPSLLRGDPGRLRQILLNLLSNALKFTAYGQVVLHVDLLADQTEECRLHFEVRDTGIGIPAQKLSSLFTPFTQVDSSTTRRFGGTGLGLAISRQLVELMGGRIGVISPFPPNTPTAAAAGENGYGAAFWFDLGFERQAVVSQMPAVVLGDLAGKRVLVLNGLTTPRTVLDMLLVEWQCIPHFAGSDSEALAQMRALHAMGQAADVAIIDAQGAEVDGGVSFAQHVRADADLARTPLVLLSSTPQRGDGKRMKAAGVNAYLPKPVNASTLFNCLRRVIGDADLVADPSRPLITQYTLAESERRAAILLIAAHPECPECAQLARELREKLGHLVEIVADPIPPGASGVETVLKSVMSLAGRHFDLVLLDGRMPEAEALEITRHVRAGESRVLYRDIPLIGVFADTSSESHRRAFAGGLNDILPRPVDALQLDRSIVRLLRARGEAVAQPVSFADSNPRLLLAEDNPVNQMVALGLLRKLGIHDVVVVENGLEAVEAVEAASRAEFDLILMDCQMPVMDGFVATRALRDVGCTVPVIAVTAHSMTGIQERCVEAGMNEWIAKPIDFAEFASTLARWLGEATQAAAHAPPPVDTESAVPSPAPAAQAVGSQACFERDQALERLRGDVALLNELIRVFIANWPAAHKRLQDALAAGDVTSATRESHTLKGSALTVGAGLAGSVASQINELGKQGRLEEMRRLLPALNAEVDYFMAASKTLQSPG